MQMALMDTFTRVENKSLLMGNHAVHHNYLFLNICLYVLHERNLRQVIVHAKHPASAVSSKTPARIPRMMANPRFIHPISTSRVVCKH